MNDALLALPKSEFVYERTVRFQDIDAAGIVFFARFFEYFHDAYVEFLAGTAADLGDVLAAKAWAAPLVHAEADFVRALRFGDRIGVEVAASKRSSKSATVHYRVWSGDDVAAVGRTVHVAVDTTTFESMALPSAFVEALGRLPTL